MEYKNKRIADVAADLKARLDKGEDSTTLLRSSELKSLYSEIPTLAPEIRGQFGQEVNRLRSEIEKAKKEVIEVLEPIDVTAPFDINTPLNNQPALLSAEQGSKHPLMTELKTVLDIFNRMGFVSVESTQIDDEFHMFTSLNFPDDHPARDDYDTFITTEGLIAPAHASVMQNRLLKQYGQDLKQGKNISAVYTGRSFRNEDIDARHEHTFYQVEIMHVGKNINVGNLISTFQTFLEEYYSQKIEVRSQPFYFPFTEPSLELALSCPFCKKKGCQVCSYTGWIELLGMGMINPNVLKLGGINPTQYTGFAGGMGLDRLVMMKYGIEDIRNFHSGKLEFLRQFK